jgi:hypothetical protein
MASTEPGAAGRMAEGHSGQRRDHVQALAGILARELLAEFLDTFIDEVSVVSVALDELELHAGAAIACGERSAVTLDTKNDDGFRHCREHLSSYRRRGRVRRDLALQSRCDPVVRYIGLQLSARNS